MTGRTTPPHTDRGCTLNRTTPQKKKKKKKPCSNTRFQTIHRKEGEKDGTRKKKEKPAKRNALKAAPATGEQNSGGNFIGKKSGAQIKRGVEKPFPKWGKGTAPHIKVGSFFWKTGNRSSRNGGKGNKKKKKNKGESRSVDSNKQRLKKFKPQRGTTPHTKKSQKEVIFARPSCTAEKPKNSMEEGSRVGCQNREKKKKKTRVLNPKKIFVSSRPQLQEGIQVLRRETLKGKKTSRNIQPHP